MSGSAPTATRPRPRLKGRIRSFASPLRRLPSGPEYTVHETVDGRRVFVHREVLEELAALEREEHPRETAGLLFGRLFTDGSNECALVRHLIPPWQGEVIGTRATVTITAHGSSRMMDRAWARFPCEDAVGWAHTHPTFDAYFSGIDRSEQSIWTAPASVGLVLSGLADATPQYRIFVGPGSDGAFPVARPETRELSEAPPPDRSPVRGEEDGESALAAAAARPGRRQPTTLEWVAVLVALAAIWLAVLLADPPAQPSTRSTTTPGEDRALGGEGSSLGSDALGPFRWLEAGGGE